MPYSGALRLFGPVQMAQEEWLSPHPTGDYSTVLTDLTSWKCLWISAYVFSAEFYPTTPGHIAWTT